MKKTPKTCLVGDIGGTNVRLAIADLTDTAPKISAPQSLPRANHATFEEVVDGYLKAAGGPVPDCVVVAVAGPISNGVVKLTNGQWVISEAVLKERGFGEALLINDYAALGYAVEHLSGDDLADIGGPFPNSPRETVGVVGAGTGLGVAALVRDSFSSAVMVTEGGHTAFAPVDETEYAILAVLKERYGRVSTERVLSGPGLSNIHWALARLKGLDIAPLDPAEVSKRAQSGTDPLSAKAFDVFLGIYGRFAGDMALAFGARGGIYLGGGIAPRFLKELNNGTFRRGFEEKGRFVGYVSPIPTKVIVHPYAALLGSAEAAIRAFVKR
ncbi:glucokinase [Rhizomicrobium palustre]|uniref:Glucokinase n=1 Tax=Rhizomicrobium palustre TaxID=189966 RepID=A0A846MVX6_9PROT|nr:glucokinase [Rhizomicrobium palustre]